MKASSPPPPPIPTSPPPIEAPPPTPSAPTVATWPKWHASADVTAAVFIAVAAFLAGSFAARNSDVWRHLAGGRLVAAFDYPWGGDPFSYTAESRPWVNTSWLYDLGLYAAYKIDRAGSVPVAIKAVAFVAVFGLTFLLRRSGHALWPWVVCAALGVLTAAPSATLRPVVGSMLFLAATLVVIYRGGCYANKWRVPGILAGLFAVWANVDAWFVLGPLTVALVLVGELLQRRLFAAADAPTADDPFPPAPPVAGLGRALLVGTAACLLNPTLLAGLVKDPADAFGQMIPADLGWGLPADVTDDPELAHLALTPLSPGFMENPAFGYNLNGLAALILFVGGAAALAFDFTRLRVAHLLLWVGFAAIALQSHRLLPFFAVVAVPLAAAHLNGLSTRARLRGTADPGTRVLLTLSGVGRIVTVPAAAVLAVAGWPGWLHPPTADPAFTRRAEWVVVPDPGPQRAAEVVAKWRAAGDIADAHGLSAGPEFADYAAWFAPGEKTFVDSRYGFHSAAFADMLKLRKELGLVRTQADGEPDPAAVRELSHKYDAKYLVLPGAGRGIAVARDEHRERFVDAVFRLIEGGQWRLWHLDGRAAITGRSDGPAAEKLRFDPVRLAYGPDVPLVPKGSANPPPAAKPVVEWYEVVGQFLEPITARPKPLPPEVDDAAVYDHYGRVRLEKRALNFQVESTRRLQARAAAAGVAPVVLGGTEPPPADDSQFAYPLLALRAARTAAAVCPDRAEPYRVLAWAYEGPSLVQFQPMNVPVIGPRFAGPGQPPVGMPYSVPGDRPEQLIAALVRALARLPKPEDCPPDLALFGLSWNLQLAELYNRPPPRNLPREQFDEYLRNQQLDLSREALRASGVYAKVAAQTPGLLLRVIPPGSKVDDPAAAVLKDLTERESRTTALVVQRNDAVDQRAGPDKPAERFLLAASVGLPGKAIEAFKEVKDPNEFGGGDQHLAAAVQMIELELRAGRLEEAAADVNDLAEAVGAAGKAGDNRTASDAVRYLRFRVARVAGNYEAAGEGWVELFAGRLPQLTPEGKAAAVGFPAGGEAAAWALGGVLGWSVYDSAANQAGQMSQVLKAEAGFHYNRAVLALQEGNMKEATARFEQALKPQGVDLAALGDEGTAKQINLYLRLIRKATGK